jgi:hypothetical protein
MDGSGQPLPLRPTFLCIAEDLRIPLRWKSTGAVGLVSFDFIDARIDVAALRLALLSSAQQLPE